MRGDFNLHGWRNETEGQTWFSIRSPHCEAIPLAIGQHSFDSLLILEIVVSASSGSARACLKELRGFFFIRTPFCSKFHEREREKTVRQGTGGTATLRD